jgi:hypothetical protein
MASHTSIRIVALGLIAVAASVGEYLLNEALHENWFPELKAAPDS